MTAEIAVLNKSAVALAADSAVTISRGHNSEKTYNVNKLFTLSKVHPVGVMVFDNAEMMGVPWETILKIYRRDLGRKSFATVEEYARNFIQYIGSAHHIFSAAAQQKIFGEAVLAAFVMIRGDASKKIKQMTTDGKSIPERKIRDVYETVIKNRLEWVMDRETLGGVPVRFRNKLAKGYSDIIDQQIKNLFEKIKLTQKGLRQLRTLAIEMFVRGRNPFGKTGVVVAGFGEDQMFPAVSTFVAHAVFKDQLLFRFDEGLSLSFESQIGAGSVLEEYAAVIPFAQTDVVRTFVNGVDPKLLDLVNEQISQLLNKFPEILAEMAGLSDNDKEDLKKTLQKHNEQAFEHIQDQLSKRIRETHQQPLLDIVSSLPKDELANIASALVELTSVKRKISRGLETVGGPIDVAVISKGDGFVWISRKHYFRPELNVRFTSSYFRETDHDKNSKR